MATRIDKYLWAIRVFKTRTEAADACKGGKIRLNGTSPKPSKEIAPGDEINVRKGAVTYSFKVIQPLETRVGAKLVPEYALNTTPESELIKLRAPVETFFVQRDRGTGRPTKKERRDLDSLYIDFDSDDSALDLDDFDDEQ